jgi:shikimate kinase
MNVTLIGMAGAGKSYIGKKVAHELELDFVDIDQLLETAYGKPIQSILDELGEERYIDVEAEMLVAGTSGRVNMLIAPGGSIIYRAPTMRHVKDISKVIYLKVPFEVIEARLANVPPRAVIGLGRKTLRELYDERHPLYEENADLILESGGLSSDELVKAVLDFLGVDKKSNSVF